MKIKPKYIIGIGAIAGLLYLIMKTKAEEHVHPNVYTLAIYVDPPGCMSSDISNPPPGLYSVNYGQKVVLQFGEVPEVCKDYEFDYWEVITDAGTTKHTTDTVELTIARDTTAVLHLRKKVGGEEKFNVTISVAGLGNTNPPPGTYEVDPMSEFTIVAIETWPNWRFNHWEINMGPGWDIRYGKQLTFVVEDNTVVKAVFSHGGEVPI